MTALDSSARWPLKPLRRLATTKSSNVDKVMEEGEETIRLCNYVDVYYNDRITGDIEFNVGSAKPQEIAKFALRAGDVILTKDSETPDDIAVPALVEQSAEGVVCGYHLAILRPRPSEVIGPYLFWALKAKPTREAFGNAAQGVTRYGLTLNGIGSVSIPVPDLDTQKAIAAYLDRETIQIDQLIEKRSRFIVLIKEKRGAVIAHAVTKGINPNVEFKDSGLDWLGKIPAHWQLVPPTALFTESKERARDGDKLLSATQKYGVIPLAEFEEIEQRQVTLAVSNLEMRKHVEIGDFVISMRSMDGGLERAHAQGSVRSSYSVLKPKPNVEARFYGALLKSSPYIQALRQTANFIRDGQDMNFSHFRKVRLPKFDVQEQTAIADYIETETARIDSLLKLTERSIDRLRERRAALITAVVAGQLDIREKRPAVTTMIDRMKFRVIVGAEIIHRHQGNPRFGRVKLQKELYLAEAHLGIDGLQGNYLREAAGPLDRTLVEETERGVEAARFYRTRQPDGARTAVTYTPLSKAGQHKAELNALLGPKADALRNLITLLSDLDRRATEAVATLYAVWNDALIDGTTPDDAAIINGVLNEWHTEKGEKFTAVDLARWLGWMKRQHLTPRGQGPRTTHTTTRDMFA
jgi:type I restriction enzyme S subunit